MQGNARSYICLTRLYEIIRDYKWNQNYTCQDSKNKYQKSRFQKQDYKTKIPKPNEFYN